MGSTFSRAYIEKVSGIFTGSDIPALCPLPLDYGFLGEEVWDRVIVFKSHYPYVRSPEAEIIANKTVVVVRDPFDTISSQIQCFLTATHWTEADNDLSKEDP
jgi:hypothetical protein